MAHLETILPSSSSIAVVNALSNTDGTIDISNPTGNVVIGLSSLFEDSIISAIQPGDNITELNNDAGYITSVDIAGKENISNKENVVLDNSPIKYPTNNLVKTYIDNTISGAIILQGDWNAATNTPDISGTTNVGYAWRVSVAGNTNLGGITNWGVNDLAVKSVSGWVKVDNQIITTIWGSIGGNIVDQTDLQAALDNKVTKNAPITAGTKAKITFDSKGLITSATDLLHNETVSLQGGAPGEYYHLSSSQLSRVLNLIYVNSVNSISNLTALAERGVSTSVSIRYSMQSNDDIFTAASIDNGVGNVLSRVNTGINDIVAGTFTNTTTFTLSMTYTRNGIPTNETKSATFTTVIPKWSNVSATSIINTYALCTANLNPKILTTATAMNNTGSATNQYIWFVTTNSAATITDGNNFVQSIGPLNVEDGTSEFYKKSFTLVLQDFSSVTMYSYRSRTLKTFTSNIYKIT